MSRPAHSTASPAGRCDVAGLLENVRATRGQRPEYEAAHRASPDTPEQWQAENLIRRATAGSGVVLWRRGVAS